MPTIQVDQKTSEVKIFVQRLEIGKNLRFAFTHYRVVVDGPAMKAEAMCGSRHDVEKFLEGVNAAMVVLKGKEIEFPRIPKTPTHQI